MPPSAENESLFAIEILLHIPSSHGFPKIIQSPELEITSILQSDHLSFGLFPLDFQDMLAVIDSLLLFILFNHHLPVSLLHISNFTI